MHHNTCLAFFTGGDGSHSVLSPEKMGPVATNIPLLLPIWHGKPGARSHDVPTPHNTDMKKQRQKGESRCKG